MVLNQLPPGGRSVVVSGLHLEPGTAGPPGRHQELQRVGGFLADQVSEGEEVVVPRLVSRLLPQRTVVDVVGTRNNKSRNMEDIIIVIIIITIIIIVIIPATPTIIISTIILIIIIIIITIRPVAVAE